MGTNVKVISLFRAMLVAFWVAFGALGAFTWWGLDRGAADLREVHDVRMKRADQLTALVESQLSTRLELLTAFQHAPDSPTRAMHDHPAEQHLKAYDARRETIDATRKAVGAAVTDARERALWQTVDMRWDAFRAKALVGYETVRNGSFSPEAIGVFVKGGGVEGRALIEALTAMRQHQLEQALAASEQAAKRQTTATWVFLATAFGVGVPGTWLCLGVLARLRRGFDDAAQVAQSIAGGDLTRRMVVTRRDEIGELAGHLESMRQHLAGVIRQVRGAADSIEVAASEVAAGNMDLSQRTEATASNLQTTASSAEQLGATVRQNADHARQANQLAVGASDVVSRGGAVVAEVVETMKGIHDSSSRIADIIGVIDGIAFQTNILALNAAVEAARAGEQGRGFAVVASEVRSLAQRSAEAAREIKGLIGTSVGRVDEGTRQANTAGATMQEVVAAIRRVTDIVGEISHASEEQSAGVAQVGAAVSRMDEATQQNAALVEQSAAAAASLRTQANDLVRAVAVFKVEAAA